MSVASCMYILDFQTHSCVFMFHAKLNDACTSVVGFASNYIIHVVSGLQSNYIFIIISNNPFKPQEWSKHQSKLMMSISVQVIRIMEMIATE